MTDLKPRLEQLRDMVVGATQRMESPTCTDQNYAVLGKMRRELLAEIEQLGGSTTEPKKTGLSEFEKRLSERTARAKAPRRAKAR